MGQSAARTPVAQMMAGGSGHGETCEDINDCVYGNGNDPCDVRDPRNPALVLVSGTCEDQGVNLYSCLYATGSGR